MLAANSHWGGLKMLQPKGRVVMVSGANRGIGLAIARGLLAKEYDLSLGVRDPDGMAETLTASPPQRLSIHAYDARRADAGAAWVAATLAQHGRIDALVNNAGIHRRTRLEDEDESGLDELWEVNVKAPLRVIRAALPHLRETGCGRVVNLASLAGKRVIGEAIGYTMSKYAVVALTHQVRRSGWDDGVRATAICPGFVNSDMAAALTEEPSENMTQPEDIAELVATAIALPNRASVAEMTVHWRYEVTL
jgi:NADP-dependent 3-hydroxy acid dehydrogenase YdfG